MNLQTDCTIERDLQRQLAERLWGHSKAPEDALKFTFGAIMIRMEEITHTTFDRDKKERVWSVVSVERVKNLQESFISKVCDKILGGFEENEISSMIEEHQRTGIIQHKNYSARLKNLFHIFNDFIIDEQLSRARAMTKGWIPEIVNAFKTEGIYLSESELGKLIK